ncbi:hypothetical protein [Papillibacter cinnamivorans]|uniref:Uncharacterized protein n=1 Tax=Papillibacter cinnamivorans DSM 12816 TaxID=1122930 RepID=A0A1W2AN34_9FIRM|nr:hypothetical protein [Papillibacter cinnamivorans]SMC62105.1 hypothetical protein SAMN02745168_1853 [Papillibacter cinnamivorans DSM 12816]
MIFDKVDRRIKEMKELRRLEGIKVNRAQQEATDSKYRTLVNQASDFIEELNYVQDYLQFFLADTIKTDLEALLINLQNAIKTGYADKDAVSSADTDFKSIQTAVKKDWAKHFTVLTSTTTNTLRVISGINSEKVSSCLADIKAAEVWVIDRNVFLRLKEAIDNADSLIQSLSLDQEIILFLTSMTAGRATIADLKENVLAWIRKESLEGKIKLSFSSR